jgi:hypothetical protein
MKPIFDKFIHFGSIGNEESRNEYDKTVLETDFYENKSDVK